MASLLDRSLDDLARQDKESSRKSSNRGRGGSSRGAGRAAPYARPSRVDHDADTWQHDLFNTNKLDYGDDPSSSGGGGESARAGRSDEDGPRSTRLKITNLHYEVSEEELRVLFEQVGPLAPPAGGRETSNPAIKYDISGRSEEEATVTYESEADAARAKEVFDNALAKGKRMTIEYDFTMPRRPRRQENDVLVRGIPKGGLSGSGNPLLSRLQPAPAANNRDNKPKRERGVRNENTRGRGTPPVRGRGSAAAPRGRGSGRPTRDRPAKTVADLDKELEDFMASGSTEQKEAADDIDMA